MQTTCEPAAALNVRGTFSRVFDEVLTIEHTSFPAPWSAEDFVHCMRQPNHDGEVYARDGRVIGYMVYELFGACIRILNFAVAGDYRRCGVGSGMIADLISKLSEQDRQRIVADVSEWNTEAHLFFRSMGFRAARVIRSLFDGDVSGYRFLLEAGD